MPRTSKKSKSEQEDGTKTDSEPPTASVLTAPDAPAKSEAAAAAKPGPARKRKRTRHGKNKDNGDDIVTSEPVKAPENKSASVAATPAKQSAPASGPTNGQTGGTKRKRARRRNRRTAAAASESDDSSSSDSSDDDEVPNVLAAASPSSSSSSSSSDDSSDSDSDSDDNKVSRSASQPAKPVPKVTQPSDDQLGPDPESLQPALNEQTRRGLAYAQQFARDRTSWKFQKQRQNWLLRHALDIELDSSIPGPDHQHEHKANGAAQAGKDGEDDDDGPVRIPREYSRALAWYFANMLGGAKVRIVSDLREAANAAVIEDEAKLVESSDASETAKSGSFSLGHLAMQKEAQEQKDAAAAGETGPKVPDQSEIRRKKEAARELLLLMGENV